MISWWNKRFSANNLILLTSAFGLGHKILLPQFTTFTGNNDLFLSALRASRNKRIIFCFKSFISSLDHYNLRIIIITVTQVFYELHYGNKMCVSGSTCLSHLQIGFANWALWTVMNFWSQTFTTYSHGHSLSYGYLISPIKMRSFWPGKIYP